LVKQRGRYMQEAVPQGVGAMAAILKLADGKLDGILAEAAQGEIVTAANFNSPEQIVIAGHAGAVARACELAKAAGAKRAIALPVSAPFHCPLMKPAQERMAADLNAANFHDLTVPLVNNWQAREIRTAAEAREGLYQQVPNPVRWVETIRYLAGQGTACFVEVGAGVIKWKRGDRVLANPLNKAKGLMGEMLDGGMAQYCLLSADQLIAMPADVTFEEAAALPVAYGTAHRMLITHNTVKKGDRVLILGASGGVGTGCVILAKMLGAEVIACSSSESKLQALKTMGADEVIDYTKTDFSKWATEKYGKPQRRSYEGGVDVVINFTGGDTWVPSLRCVKRGGKILVCGATAGHDPKEDLRYIWTFELNIVGSNSFYDDNLSALMQLIQDGKFKPVIDKVLPLEQAREGLRLIQDREVIGKVVVAP